MSNIYEMKGRVLTKVKVGDCISIFENQNDRTFSIEYSPKRNTMILVKKYYIVEQVYPGFVIIREAGSSKRNTMCLGDLVCAGFEPAAKPE